MAEFIEPNKPNVRSAGGRKDSHKAVRAMKILSVAALLVLALYAGDYFGVGTEKAAGISTQESNYLKHVNNRSPKIAIVNLDDGIFRQGQNKSYSDDLLSGMDEAYKAMAYTVAEEGLANGDIDAIITIPSDFSNKVTGIDLKSPEKISLGYETNKNLPSDRLIETSEKVALFQNLFNYKLSYTYIYSLYEELHSAQDQSTKLIGYNEENIKAVETLDMRDFAEDLSLGELPEAILELIDYKENVSSSIASTSTYINDIVQIYESSYSKAKEEYKTKSDAFSSEAGIVNNKINEFTASAITYNTNTGEWVEGAKNWASEVNTWKDTGEYATWMNDTSEWVTQLPTDVGNWFTEGDGAQWITDAAIWIDSANVSSKGLSDYQTGLVSHSAILDAYETTLGAFEESLYGYEDSLHDYGDKLDDFRETLLSDFDIARDKYMDDLEIYKDLVTNHYWTYLDDYLVNLNKHKDNLNQEIRGFNKNSQTTYDDLSDYYKTLEDFYIKNDLKFNLSPPKKPSAVSIVNTNFQAEPFRAPPNPPKAAYDPEEVPKTPEFTEILAPADIPLFPELPDIPDVPELPEALEPPEYPKAEDAPTLSTFPEALPDELSTVPALDKLMPPTFEWDPSSYVSQTERDRATQIITNYSNLLGTLNKGFSATNDKNINQINDAYAEYNKYLVGIKQDIEKAYTKEHADLNGAKSKLITTLTGTAIDTRNLIGDFSEAMPNSRSYGSVNTDLADFIATPVEMNLAEGIDEVNIPLSAPDGFNTILPMVAAIILIIAVITGLILYIRKRRDSAL
jgi:uncharacterized phage infection (PIP) family protein YhgE